MFLHKSKMMLMRMTLMWEGHGWILGGVWILGNPSANVALSPPIPLTRSHPDSLLKHFIHIFIFSRSARESCSGAQFIRLFLGNFCATSKWDTCLHLPVEARRAQVGPNWRLILRSPVFSQFHQNQTFLLLIHKDIKKWKSFHALLL